MPNQSQSMERSTQYIDCTPQQPATISNSDQVELLFKEYKNCRLGLLAAFNEGYLTLLDVGSRIKKDTPYNERMSLWGCDDMRWKLEPCKVPTYRGCVQPQPLLPFDMGVRQDEWISRMCDYSEAWLTAFIMEKATKLQAEERIRLMELMDGLEALKFEIKYESLSGTAINLNEIDDLEREVEPEVLKCPQGGPSDCMRNLCSYRDLQPEALVDEWVQCAKCKRWFHCICIKISSTEATSETYWCRECDQICGTGLKKLTIYNEDLVLGL